MDLDEGASTPCLVDYDEAYYDSCLKEDFPRLFKNKCNSEIELLYNTDQTPGNGVATCRDKTNLTSDQNARLYQPRKTS